MLVLSRKETEELVISDQIRIRVLRISGGTIRLGIEAPKDVSVRRAELAAREPMELETAEELSELSSVI
jgi:carbon storage regulator